MWIKHFGFGYLLEDHFFRGSTISNLLQNAENLRAGGLHPAALKHICLLPAPLNWFNSAIKLLSSREL